MKVEERFARKYSRIHDENYEAWSMRELGMWNLEIDAPRYGGRNLKCSSCGKCSTCELEIEHTIWMWKDKIPKIIYAPKKRRSNFRKLRDRLSSKGY